MLGQVTGQSRAAVALAVPQSWAPAGPAEPHSLRSSGAGPFCMAVLSGSPLGVTKSWSKSKGTCLEERNSSSSAQAFGGMPMGQLWFEALLWPKICSDLHTWVTCSIPEMASVKEATCAGSEMRRRPSGGTGTHFLPSLLIQFRTLSWAPRHMHEAPQGTDQSTSCFWSVRLVV